MTNEEYDAISLALRKAKIYTREEQWAGCVIGIANELSNANPQFSILKFLKDSGFTDEKVDRFLTVKEIEKLIGQ